MCAEKFPLLICRPIAAQFMSDEVIALFEFAFTEKGVAIPSEKHYFLVSSDEMTSEDLEIYRKRPL
jgi:hypothetical protein